MVSVRNLTKRTQFTSKIQFCVLVVTDKSFKQYMADNVNYVCTLNGLNTFHGMGIIATVTSKINLSFVVPKKIVSTD